MNIAIVDPYYALFLAQFYQAHPAVRSQSYAKQHRTLLDQCFGTADYYSRNLAPIGHDATELIVNAEPLQRAWGREHGMALASPGLRDQLARMPYLNRLVQPVDWLQPIVLAQLRDLKPDLLYCQDLTVLTPETLREVRRYIPHIVGQIASPIPDALDPTVFDLIVTAAPHFVPKFRERGVASAYLKIGFEPTVLKRLKAKPGHYGAVFIGGFSRHHAGGSRVFEQLVGDVPVDFWGYGTDDLAQNSPILDHFHGPAWGIAMYQTLASAKLCVNRHVDVAGEYAGNMRLFEATGVGTMLITDWKKNLGEFFEPGKEVETYRSPEELADKVRYYLSHDSARAKIARAGQRRTLREHTYARRMKELDRILRTHFGKRKR
ncbi:glycosyltransferase family 1 protein [Candidatus Berkelbacteria bacterium]|nr:glycosyltransferase family 1 protein [Candidatus Berkelbacteria bacterium]